jgi:hypothetical protein
MLLLVLGGMALMYLVWLGRGQPLLRRSEYRLGAGLTSLGGVFAAAFLTIRGDWQIGLVLLAIAVGLLVASRDPVIWPARRKARAVPPPPGQIRDRSGLTAEEARAVLGVREEATVAEIRAAYARLMRTAHPDRGGTAGLAAQLNAARDRLLKR